MPTRGLGYSLGKRGLSNDTAKLASNSRIEAMCSSVFVRLFEGNLILRLSRKILDLRRCANLSLDLSTYKIVLDLEGNNNKLVNAIPKHDACGNNINKIIKLMLVFVFKSLCCGGFLAD